MSETVSPEGQVTIPEAVRNLLGIVPGSQVEFRQSDDGRIILERIEDEPPASRFAALRGHAGPGMSTDEVMALTRGED